MATKKPAKHASESAPVEAKKTRTLSVSDTAWVKAGVHAAKVQRSISAMVEEFFMGFPDYEEVVTGKKPKA